MGKVENKANHIILAEMKKIYEPNHLDWMYYTISKRNRLTLHHIEKEADGGLTIIENGALLTKRAHSDLNLIEGIDYRLYVEWNTLFNLINVSRGLPNEEHTKEMLLLKRYTMSTMLANNIIRTWH